MKIIKLKAENIKKIKAIEIEPKGNVVKISGKNGNGKTSVLDSIWYALGGTKPIPEQPIRNGEKKASIELTLDDYIVERKWTSNENSYLKIMSKEGVIYPTPQKLLDKIVGDLSFNPLDFANAEKGKQVEMLIKAIKMPFDKNKLEEISKVKISLDLGIIENFNRAYKAVYDERTMINRETTNLEERLKAIPSNPGKPTEKISVKELLDKKTGLEIIYRDITSKLEKINRLKAEIAEKQSEIDKLTADLKQNKETPDALDTKIKVITEILSKADETNKLAEQVEYRKKVSEELKEKISQSEAMSKRLESIRSYKEDLLKASKMPISGLDFKDGGVTYNGLPFNQSSSAEQLKISLAIAMALNPELRVIRITDGSLLDGDSMKIVEALAKDNDYQVWIEVVDDTGKLGIYIEDGEINGNKQ